MTGSSLVNDILKSTCRMLFVEGSSEFYSEITCCPEDIGFRTVFFLLYCNNCCCICMLLTCANFWHLNTSGITDAPRLVLVSFLSDTCNLWTFNSDLKCLLFLHKQGVCSCQCPSASVPISLN